MDYPAPSKTFGCSKILQLMDNVLSAMNSKQKRSFFTSVLRLPKFFYHKEAAMKEKVMELLRIFDLENKKPNTAKIFLTVNNDVLRSFGHWLLNQRSFFLDEPKQPPPDEPSGNSGLTKLIYRIQKDFQLTILLIEHDMSLVMEVL